MKKGTKDIEGGRKVPFSPEIAEEISSGAKKGKIIFKSDCLDNPRFIRKGDDWTLVCNEPECDLKFHSDMAMDIARKGNLYCILYE